MALAIVLLPIVVASVLFQFLSPWRLSPVGSSWGHIDDTLIISLVITGVVFVAINLFIAGRRSLSEAAAGSVDIACCRASVIAYDIFPDRSGPPVWP